MTAIRPVSVVICTRNRAERLPKVIGLLRAQDYPQEAMEIVVVDNHSTDQTSQVVRRLAAQPGVPVRYVYEAREGITCARNRGAEEGRHSYLAYIDDDCSIRSDWLRELMSGFDLDPRVVAVGGLVLVKWEDQRPRWLGPAMDAWLADTSFLGTRRRLLDDDERVVESNTAFARNAWQAAGSFVGMEQFGSQSMAAGEVLYLLHQLRRNGGKIAFVPEALMYHHVHAPSRKLIMRRAYWQGVSDALLDDLLHERAWTSIAWRSGRDLAALLVLLGLTAASCLRRNDSRTMFQLARVLWRFGFLSSEMRVVGDWPRVRSWVAGGKPTGTAVVLGSNHHDGRSATPGHRQS
jgi:glycosyltransferase involved in cell wall biosynthesis